MNKLIIIGNLTREPEKRVTPGGKTVCNFTVAVNGRKDQEAQFFRVSAWGQTAENCARYLDKGRKVCVTGQVSLNTYQGQDGQTRASLEVFANEVEFLSSASTAQPAGQNAENHGMTVVEPEDNPFVGEDLPF